MKHKKHENVVKREWEQTEKGGKTENGSTGFIDSFSRLIFIF